MAYNSAHTGPEIDAAVQLLGQIQEARDSTSQDLSKVTDLASQVKVEAAQVAGQAEAVTSKASQVSQDKAVVEQARQEVVSAAAAASEAMDSASLSAASALESQNAASISEHSAAGSQLAAGLSEQVSAESASEAKAAAAQAEDDRKSAAESAASAAASAANAEAVVTGGSASVNPGPGLIPLADAQGVIDGEWIPDDIARTAAVEAAAKAADEALDAVAESRASLARFLLPSPEAPVIRDDGSPLQAGDRYTNTIDQAEYLYTYSGWQPNESLQAIADIEGQISSEPSQEAIPRSDANGKLLDGWFPDSVARTREVADVGQGLVRLGGKIQQNANIFSRELLLNLGFRDQHYDSLVQSYGYSFIYPQQIAVDESAGELLIIKSVGGGSNSFAWIWVHDISSGLVKSVFTTGERWYESLVVRYIDGKRYVYTIGDGGAPIRFQLDELPVNYTKVDIDARYPSVPGYSIMAFDGLHWYVQDVSGYLGQSRRNRFLVYSEDFSSVFGVVSLPLDSVGTINSAYLNYFPKMQNLCFHGGALYAGIGGAYVPATDADKKDSPSTLAGISVFLPTGEKVSSALSHPDAFIDKMSELTGYRNTASENEGCASSGDFLYTLWVTLGPAERADSKYAGKGIVICRELAKSASQVDFRSAASLARSAFNLDKFCATNHASSSQLKNPVTGDPLTSFAKICQMMQDLGLPRYAFYGPNQAIVDVNGTAVVTGSRLFEFTNASGQTYIIKSTGFSSETLQWVVGGAGSNQSGPYYSGEEIGSNTNGWFVKHASGVLECFLLKPDGLACSTASGPVYRNDASWTWTFPAEFVSGGPTPSVTGNPCFGNRWWGGTTGQPSRVSCNPVIFSSSSDLISRPLTLEAKGRWRI